MLCLVPRVRFERTPLCVLSALPLPLGYRGLHLYQCGWLRSNDRSLPKRELYQAELRTV